ncbi:MAG: hypothetical protein HKN42_03125, partial [Granulosicoccus sp.]|nr:hypothetical protein [Granulosicoccus sp.]
MNAITKSKHRLVLLLLTLTSCALFAVSAAVYKTSSAEVEVAAGAMLVAAHEVGDFARWKQVYDSAAESKARFGWLRGHVFTENGNPNQILVIEEFKSMEQARQFAELRELRSAMIRSGMIGEPEFRFLTRVS